MKVIELTKSYTKRSETLTDKASCYSYYLYNDEGVSKRRTLLVFEQISLLEQ